MTSTVVTLLCCLLAVATSAYAEVVWVSWLEMRITTAAGPERPRYSEWVIMGTFATKQKCTDIVERILADPDQDGFVRVGDTLVGTKEDMRMVKRFLCLPDTIDPRGPKGSK